MITQTDLAWLAGLIDGEGSFSIYHTIGGIKNKHGIYSRYWRLSFSLGMTHQPTIMKVTGIIRLLTDGKGSLMTLKTQRGTVYWRISLGGSISVKSLAIEVLPYMITKREDAEIIIEACKRVGIPGRHNKIDLSDLHERLMSRRIITSQFT